MPFGGELDSFAESPACSDAIGRDVDNGQACAIGIIRDTRVYYFRLIVDSCRDVGQVLFVEPTDTVATEVPVGLGFLK
jgi:hypothetical protein